MKRIFLLLAVIGLLTPILRSSALAERSRTADDVFQPFYWVSTNVTNPAGVSLAGKKIYLYKTYDDKEAGRYALADLSAGRITLNGFDLGFDNFQVGQNYLFATDPIELNGRVYGAKGLVAISGDGWDEPASDLVIAPGYVPTMETVEEAPTVKIWYGYRLYQPLMVTEDKPFIVSAKPVITLDLAIDEPFALSGDASKYSATVLNKKTNLSSNLEIKAENFSKKILAAEASAADSLRSLSIQLTPELADGVNVITFSASSSGALGVASVLTALSTVEVLGGPGELVGLTLTFPSPYSIERDKLVTIQYALTRDLAIQIIFVDVSGQRVKNFIIEAGQDGGAAGINKITWDGRTDRGTLAGNGIYLGTIIARDEGRRLGSVKLTVVN